MPLGKFIKNLKNKMKKAKKLFKKEKNIDNTINHKNTNPENTNPESTNPENTNPEDINTINQEDINIVNDISIINHEYDQYFENIYYKKNYVPSHDEAVENAVNAAKKYLDCYI